MKFSHSGGGYRVEVSALDHLVYIRDPKDPHGPVLAVTPQASAGLPDARGWGRRRRSGPGTSGRPP
ncbi:DUF397 domain-containing protein [Kitasatospora sp. NPDC058046]|uniref:DUF397 domain-containing protein n=1 Tax=Kitasatospora sp. NPDC058046 TaxID=3346312 RepID=UPI0036DC958E